MIPLPRCPLSAHERLALGQAGRLRDLRMHELWPMRKQLDELNLYSSEWLFQHLDEAKLDCPLVPT